jgi:hypothetical protein
MLKFFKYKVKLNLEVFLNEKNTKYLIIFVMLIIKITQIRKY